MGATRKDTNDTMYFAVRRNTNIRKLIEVSYDYPTMNTTDKNKYKKIMKNTVFDFINQEIDDSKKSFGWKFGEPLFTSQILMETFPTAKVIHLIRDGRDVMLSRIKSRFEKKFRTYLIN